MVGGGCRYGGFTTGGTLANFLGVPGWARGQVQNKYNGRGGNRGARFFMDAQCRFSAGGPQTVVCGYAGVSWSPISLMWDSGANIDQGMTVSRFSLTTDPDKQYTLWKGSDKAPLLVFSPHGSEGITSATQLMGNVAFGGKTTSSADFTSRATRAPWGNGFEALAVLDTDGDGAVRGTELSQLSLWFDGDRNAEVGPGELQPVEKQGVVALYYRGAKKDPDSQDLRLEVGFERVVNGVVVQGAAVDWYSPTFTSKAEAMQALSSIINGGGTLADAAATESDRSWTSDPLSFAPSVTEDHANNMSGFWLWHLEEDKANRYPGIFALEQDPHSTIKGFSVIESRLKPNAEQLRSGLSILPIEGVVSKPQSGSRTIVFTVRDSATGLEARSEATLVAGGQAMTGETTQTFVEGDSKNPKRSATVRYRWTAQKIIKAPNEG